jgi:hypothetical protein
MKLGVEWRRPRRGAAGEGLPFATVYAQLLEDCMRRGASGTTPRFRGDPPPRRVISAA